MQYLIKPIKISDLYFCLNKTQERISNKNEKYTLILETSKENIKLNRDEIHYCIMFSPYIDIHTSSEKITVRKKNK